MKRAILVNGIPASGKSMVTRQLTGYLVRQGIAAVPLSLDTVKEGLFAHLGTGDRAHNRLLGCASYHGIFASIAAFPHDLVPVIDAWHGFQPVTVLQDHIARAGIERILELWCSVSPEIAARRYRARAGARSPGHPPASYADELFDLAKRAEPLSIGETIVVDAERALEEKTFGDVLAILQSSS
jgi:thymidylate kinase